MSSPSPPELRHRKPQASTTPPRPESQAAPSSTPVSSKNPSQSDKLSSARLLWSLALVVIVALSVATRFYIIHNPGQVVFDEVHFGKFASYYLRREYYFDVHPPLGKLILAATGYVNNYDGHYLFDKIGESYAKMNVPFVALRLTPAAFGALVPPLAFLTLKESGVGILGCFLGGIMTVFENALIAQSRLILLDSMLLFFCMASIYAWIRFYRLRYAPFSTSWWKWLISTGVLLACALGVKMVGLFTVAVVGIATICDLWRLLDLRRGLTMRCFGKHFAARFLALIVIPLIIYLSFFWVHFKILSKTGSGDEFMSPAFQATLIGNKMHAAAQSIPYNSKITIKHRSTSSFLHSHTDKYPLKYDDGRISSQGQQVTGYPHKDLNNEWLIRPIPCENYTIEEPLSEEIKAQCDRQAQDQNMEVHTLNTTTGPIQRNVSVLPVRNGDYIRLEHVTSHSFLLTHDVASPTMATHMEVTLVDPTSDTYTSRLKEIIWKLEVIDGGNQELFRSSSQYFRLVNAVHKVALHSHKVILPDWGFKQLEVNGNKGLTEANNNWLVETVAHESINEARILEDLERKRADAEKNRPGFFRKFFELQGLMFRHNAGLTKSHPYQSAAITWPFMLRGISFWEEKDSGKQIYLIGNPFIWWFSIITILVFVAVWVMDRLLLQRGIDDFGFKVRLWWDRCMGFLFLNWAMHYFPFFLMGRSLFLHHYFPALVCNIYVAAGIVDFLSKLLGNGKIPDLFEEGTDKNEDGDHAPLEPRSQPLYIEFAWGKYPPRVRDYCNAQFGWTHFIIVAALVILFVIGFYIFAPLTYGMGFGVVGEGLKQAMQKRKWVSEWDFQYA